MSDTLNTAILSHYWSGYLLELHLWGSQGKVLLSLKTEVDSASETSCFLIRRWKKVQKKQNVSVSHTPLSEPYSAVWESSYYLAHILCYFLSAGFSHQLSQLIRLATLAAKSNKKYLSKEKGNSVGLQYNCPNNLILFRAGSILAKPRYIII